MTIHKFKCLNQLHRYMTETRTRFYPKLAKVSVPVSLLTQIKANDFLID